MIKIQYQEITNVLITFCSEKWVILENDSFEIMPKLINSCDAITSYLSFTFPNR
jgi:hypothetical protein